MTIPVSTRVHEWFAGRISWVQYPQIRPLSKQPRRSLFRHQMPWTIRALIGTVSLIAVLVAGFALLVMLIFLKGVLFG